MHMAHLKCQNCGGLYHVLADEELLDDCPMAEDGHDFIGNSLFGTQMEE